MNKGVTLPGRAIQGLTKTMAKIKSTEDRLIEVIKDKGPLTGSQILKHIDEDPLLLIRACRLSNEIAVRIIGTRYLRFDRKIEGYARLSPSILREFLTYSIIGLATDRTAMEGKAEELQSHIERISRHKWELAHNLASALAGRIGDDQFIKEHVCFIIAGDIVFNMAHDVPRPERSTRKMVNGSDMDIVVIVDDRFPEDLIMRLDNEIYVEKGRLLINPFVREEIDYIVKKMKKAEEQMKFDTFKDMVACKIMHEGTFLHGSEDIFLQVKEMLKEKGIIEKINELEEQAWIFRKKAEEYLVDQDPARLKDEGLEFFYPAEESEEFE